MGNTDKSSVQFATSVENAKAGKFIEFVDGGMEIISDTDKTAEAIVRWNHAIEASADISEIGSVLICDEAVGGHVTTWLLADLQRMARLWLMRKEIIEELEADTEAYGHYYLAPPERKAFAAKIKALELDA